MREIKFRCYVDGEGYYSENFTMDNFSDLVNNEDYIVEQFTGLTDKNGKDIYCGDLLKVMNTKNYKGEVLEVIFEDGAFCLSYDGFVNGASETNTISINRAMFEAGNVGLEFECEITGTIHE